MARRPNYPNLLGQPSPALLRLEKSRSPEEIDKFVTNWKTELEILQKKEAEAEQSNDERAKLIERLKVLIRKAKMKKRQMENRGR